MRHEARSEKTLLHRVTTKMSCPKKSEKSHRLNMVRFHIYLTIKAMCGIVCVDKIDHM